MPGRAHAGCLHGVEPWKASAACSTGAGRGEDGRHPTTAGCEEDVKFPPKFVKSSRSFATELGRRISQVEDGIGMCKGMCWHRCSWRDSSLIFSRPSDAVNHVLCAIFGICQKDCSVASSDHAVRARGSSTNAGRGGNSLRFPKLLRAWTL